MRSLTRPFLFAMSRLSLFLAVVAWVVGQSYTAWVHLPGTISVQLRQTCWGVTVWTGASIGRHVGYDDQFDHSELTEFMTGTADVKQLMPAIRLVSGSTGTCVTIDHRMVVAVLVLIHVLLKCLFRQRIRQQEEPATDGENGLD